jgi:hypothetical protein
MSRIFLLQDNVEWEPRLAPAEPSNTVRGQPMNYKAWFAFYLKKNQGSRRCLISAFSVVGGAHRSINLDSTDDVSISSELEQARQYKNITLFMLPTHAHDDMDVAMNLVNIALEKSTLWVDFFIAKFANGKVIEELRLICADTTIIRPPALVAQHLLMIELQLPSVTLSHGKPDPTGVEFRHVKM